MKETLVRSTASRAAAAAPQSTAAKAGYSVILRDYLGLFNRFNAPQWVGNSSLAIPAVAFVEIWWGLGYHTMFFLAGLASIPKEL